MQRGLQDAPARSIFRDAHTIVLAQGGFVGAVNRPEQAPTSNQGGFVVADRQPPMRQPRLSAAVRPAAAWPRYRVITGACVQDGCVGHQHHRQQEVVEY